MSYGYNLGLTGTGYDYNTMNYINSVGAMDGLSTGALNTIFSGTSGYSSIPFAGMSYGMNIEQMSQNQESWNEYYKQNVRNNIELNKTNKSGSLFATTSEDAITRQIASLQRQIQNNKSGNVMTEYNKLLEAVANYYEECGYTVSEQQIKSTAERLYAQSTGNALVNDVEAHGDSAFAQGFKQVLTFGLTGHRSANQNIEEITGENADTGASKAGRVAGWIAGGATAFLGTIAALKTGKNLLPKIGSLIKSLIKSVVK
ncbi:hypothetical protein IJV79_01510 [bacterium]|nr:hypothetical protein [bacterium]